jgi:predicted DNA-binding protein
MEKAVAARKSKKKKTTAGREYKLRLPPALSDRIEKYAINEGKPQSRVIIEELECIPDLRSRAHFQDLVEEMENTLRMYTARIYAATVTDDLLDDIKDAVKANKEGNISEVRRLVDKLGVTLFEWDQFQRAAKK